MADKRKQYKWAYSELRKMRNVRGLCYAYEDTFRYCHSTDDYLTKLEYFAHQQLELAVGGSVYYRALSSFELQPIRNDKQFWVRKNLSVRFMGRVSRNNRIEANYYYYRAPRPVEDLNEIPF